MLARENCSSKWVRVFLIIRGWMLFAHSKFFLHDVCFSQLNKSVRQGFSMKSDTSNSSLLGALSLSHTLEDLPVLVH